jgi:hypothetical protein
VTVAVEVEIVASVLRVSVFLASVLVSTTNIVSGR